MSGALAGTEGPAHHWDDDARRVLDALAARGYYLERPEGRCVMHESCTLDGGHCGCLQPSTDALLGALKWSDLHGIDPDFTDGLPASEWLAREHCGDHHAHAIAEAAREWVAAHDALVAAASLGEDDSHYFAAEREAVGTLIAAVDAERAERGQA